MTGTPFHIVDVFAEEKYAGNQLAVFRNVGGLSSEVMQKLAKEMGFSETTFILSNTEHESGYDVRIFTPAAEVPFAGHPTLGTAYIIRHEIIKKPVPQVNLNLQVGQIPVAFERQAAYLVKHRYFGADRIDVRVEQGYEIGRPSLIYLKTQDRSGTIHVEVGGKVVPIAQGRLL